MTSRTPPQLIGGLLGWLLLCFAAGAVGAIASADAASFYGQLKTPDWAPPAWLFAPVWTSLYAMMAVSAWMVWKTHGFGRARTALVLFVVQLVANAIWTFIFFDWHLGAAAFVEILLLWVLVVATIISFWRLHTPAAVLLLPYLAWITFASALTWSTWQLNPGLL